MLLCWQRSICQTYGFSSIHVRMRQLDHKEAGHQRTDAFKLWCCRRLLRVPWMARIKPVKLTRNLPWILIGRTDAEAEAPIILPPDAKSWLIGKDPDMGILRATQWTWIWANQDIVENREAGMLQSILSKTSEFFTGYLLFCWIRE